MNMKNMMETLAGLIFGARFCWMVDDESRRVSVMVILPEDPGMASDTVRSRKLAARAKGLAMKKAKEIGPVVSAGVYMGGNGNGCVEATGIAELPWTPDVARRLAVCGMQKLL